MRLHNDDDVHRFAGRWIEVRGTVLPMQARYSAWGVFAGAWLLTFFVAYGVLGLEPTAAFVDSLAVSVFLAVLLMRFVEGDLTLRGLSETVLLDTGLWLRHRVARPDGGPRRIDYSHVARGPSP